MPRSRWRNSSATLTPRCAWPPPMAWPISAVPPTPPGWPRGDGRGGPGYRIRREASFKPFGRGAVGLQATAKDTEGSRFFITLAPDPQQDAHTTLLGTVANGLEVVDALRAHDTIDSID